MSVLLKIKRAIAGTKEQLRNAEPHKKPTVMHQLMKLKRAARAVRAKAENGD
jgi:hypothetical protein